MIYKVMALGFIAWACITYVVILYRGYQANEKYGIGKEGWLKRSSLNYQPLRTDYGWQEYEKAVKRYYGLAGVIASFGPLFLFFVAYLLWNA